MQNRATKITRYPDIVRVEPKDNYVLKVYFDNGVVKFFDCHYLFEEDYCKPLKKTWIFDKTVADLGGIIWTDEIDIAKEEVYEKGVTIDHNN